MTGDRSHLKATVQSRIGASPPRTVWTPADFLDLGSRDAIDKTLQRLVAAGELRRIDRGLYDRPALNELTHQNNPPDPRGVIDAVARRDQIRVLVDGMTAANDLGLTDAVPARIEVLADARLKPIKLGNQEIHFKRRASRLNWADRPAMRVVQALHWLQDMLVQERERQRVQTMLRRLFADPNHGEAIQDDLRKGISALPIWMQEFPWAADSLDATEVPREAPAYKKIIAAAARQARFVSRNRQSARWAGRQYRERFLGLLEQRRNQ